MTPWVQNVVAIAIVLVAAAWLLRRAIWKRGAAKGCENCPAHRVPIQRPPLQSPPERARPTARSERA